MLLYFIWHKQLCLFQRIQKLIAILEAKVKTSYEFTFIEYIDIISYIDSDFVT